MDGEDKKKGNENTKDELAGAATGARVMFPSPAASLCLFIRLFVAKCSGTVLVSLIKEEEGEKMAVRTFHP